MEQESSENRIRQEFTHHWLTVEPAVAAYVFAAVSGFHDAEDVIQQTAQEAARRFEQYDPERSFVGWVLWIAKSRVIDFYRRRQRDRLVFSEELLEQLSQAIARRADHRNERREALEHCLDELPERSRRLLDLRYAEELSANDLAVAMNSTAGSVRVLLTRVRIALADCIQRRLAMEAP